jgi:hypothetical protein
MQKLTQTTNKVEPAQPLESPASFARFIGVTAQCVRNWCHDGTIPLLINQGRIMRFERAAAMKALSGNGGAL